ncbi:MAG: hypothetical protein ABSB63_08910 [Spirochaetia bacterium]|jgi:hypothetical protein
MSSILLTLLFGILILSNFFMIARLPAIGYKGRLSYDHSRQETAEHWSGQLG